MGCIDAFMIFRMCINAFMILSNVILTSCCSILWTSKETVSGVQCGLSRVKKKPRRYPGGVVDLYHIESLSTSFYFFVLNGQFKGEP